MANGCYFNEGAYVNMVTKHADVCRIGVFHTLGRRQSRLRQTWRHTGKDSAGPDKPTKTWGPVCSTLYTT